MNNYIEFKISKGFLNLEEFLDKKGVSDRMFKKLLKTGNIRISGEVSKNRKTILKLGDVISLTFPQEKIDIHPQKIEIETLFENQDIIAINKKPFIVVHPTSNVIDKTLANAVAYYFLKNNIKSKVRIINRLDRDTSGVILFAKNTFGHQQIAKQIENKTAIRKYLVLVEGVMIDKEGIINKAIGKCQSGLRQCVRIDGSESITKYRVLEEYKNSSLLEVEILTGRTHQIRVHLHDLGHPIIGDVLYNKECKYIKRQALHAFSISFMDPREEKTINIIAPMPDDIQQLIKILKY